MDGLATYRRVLQILGRQKAIVISGYAKTARISAAMDLGAGAFVRKPFSIRQLGMAVRKELRRQDADCTVGVPRADDG